MYTDESSQSAEVAFSASISRPCQPLSPHDRICATSTKARMDRASTIQTRARARGQVFKAVLRLRWLVARGLQVSSVA